MHIFISGATGRNGRIVLDNALARGHSVTVLARDPSSSPLPSHLNLAQDVEKALTTPRPPNTIITTLNQRRISENPFSALSPDSPPDLLASTTKTLLAALTTLLQTSPPIFPRGTPPPPPPKKNHRQFPLRGPRIIAVKDHNDMDRSVRESGFAFVLARAARLTDGPAREVRVWPDDGEGCGWNAAVGRESLGRWMVSAAETDEWDGRAPVLTD
ncbi:NAD(P)-binding protein [Trichoderma novae-zelandiae]